MEIQRGLVIFDSILRQGYAKINVFSEDTWQLIRGNENLNKQGEISRDDGSLWRMISALDQ